MTKCQYAAYGSNLHPLRLARRVESARLLGIDFMATWDLRFNKQSDKDGTGKCNIVSGDSGIHVAIYELDVTDKAKLDAIEGLGAGYDQTMLATPRFGDCWTYVAEERVVNDSLQPVDWYKEMVVLGCRYHRFPDGYLDRIVTIPAQSDDNERRNRQEWQLVQALRNSA